MSDAHNFPDNVTSFFVTSGVSAFTGDPFVNIFLEFKDNSSKLISQLDVDSAREHALTILECAEASESDAAVFELFTARLGLSAEEAAGALNELRKIRQAGQDS